jgi:hypothetical protein
MFEDVKAAFEILEERRKIKSRAVAASPRVMIQRLTPNPSTDNSLDGSSKKSNASETV